MKNLARKILNSIFYFSGIWLIIRYWNRHKLIILMYHGVVEQDTGVWTQIPGGYFVPHMRYLSKSYRAIKGSDLVKALSQGDNYRVLVTFDDGFKNNRIIAYPILEDYKIPAVIFVTTSFIEGHEKWGRYIWTDYVGLVLKHARAPEIDLGHFGLGTLELDSRGKKLEARSGINAYLKRTDTAIRDSVIEELVRLADPKMPFPDGEIFESLGWEDIIYMSKNGNIEFGAHTVNHEILTSISAEDARKEIRRSKELLESRTGLKIAAFAYPNGTAEDFNENIKGMTAEYYEWAVSTIEGLNDAGSDIYELKRINVGNDMSLRGLKLAMSGTSEVVNRIFRFGRHK
ncbi:putative Polysaccharide deacetylase [Candidatus Zixiibacteriota bacterium]|nr:putative Polysaccharide deacetylase [candidate division Zixibacteria bacterium]